jgi:hypothetical protein
MTNIVLVDDAQARISAGPRSPKSTSMAPLSEAATSCWKRMRRASLRKRLGSIAPQSLHDKPDGQSVGRSAGAIRGDAQGPTSVGIACADVRPRPGDRSTQTPSLMPTLMMPPLAATLKTVTRLTVLLLLVLALGACGRSESQPQAATPPPPQVTIAKPTSKMIADQDEYVGRFVAVESVEVRARVAGYLAAIHFQDGQMVKAGDLLFTIDRRPFQIALAQAQASLAQAKATLAFAESDLTRAQGLAVGTVITQQTFDQRTQAKRIAEASVAAQQAAERQANVPVPQCSARRLRFRRPA